MKEALVKNAGDAEQVKSAEKKEQFLRRRELADLKEILKMPHGRRFLWRLMKTCKTYESVFDDNVARTNYNSGRQDVGHFVLSEIAQADPAAYFAMVDESNKEEVNA